MSDDKWKVWDEDEEYGDLFFKRATGVLDEMESAKSVCHLVKNIYKPGMKIVDVGCGAGHYLRSLKKRVDEGIDYTGVDATEKYVSLARKAFTKSKFEVGDILNLPFPDESFDIVMNNNVVLHLPPPPLKAIRELLRVSKKHIIIRTLFGERNYIIKEVRSKDYANDVEGIIELDDLVSENKIQSYNYFNLFTEDFIVKIINHIDSNIKIDIKKDNSWQKFDNREDSTRTGTYCINDYQVSGNILLDWRYILLTK